jgi:hypothetical protein
LLSSKEIFALEAIAIPNGKRKVAIQLPAGNRKTKDIEWKNVYVSLLKQSANAGAAKLID